MESCNLSFSKVTSNVGAIIHGINLRTPITPEIGDFLQQMVQDHGVIFLRDQDLTSDHMKALAVTFGTPAPEPEHPGVTEPVSLGDMHKTKRVTCVWHSDSTFVAVPPIATALRAVQLPPVGGDTCWANMHAAYDALSEPLRSMLDGLTALHSKVGALERLPEFYAQDAERIRKIEAIHPVVLVHPQTGRKALFVNQAWTRHIVELEPAESAHVLALLFEHVKSQDFSMRWRWSPNDVALWDNRTVQHYAVPDYDSARVMQRVVILGE